MLGKIGLRILQIYEFTNLYWNLMLVKIGLRILQIYEFTNLRIYIEIRCWVRLDYEFCKFTNLRIFIEIRCWSRLDYEFANLRIYEFKKRLMIGYLRKYLFFLSKIPLTLPFYFIKIKTRF